jgi:pilus assembly protein CpaB
MSTRNLLLILGSLSIVLGLAVGYASLKQTPPAPIETVVIEKAPKTQVLVAAHAISTGTLLQSSDLVWKDVAPGELRPGNLARGEANEAEFFGAIARRDFAEGEALIASDVLKHNDRRFLAAVLKPGNRAVSIAVDATQSASGLMLPGNYVDIILTQTLAESAEKKRSVGETILTNVRVIAVDQALGQPLTRSASAADSISQPVEARLPKTVTLEVTERQAEKVFVALQMGALQLSVRPLELASETGADDTGPASSATWSSDVSAAVKKSSRVPALNSGSTLEAYIRRPPAS